MKQALCALLLLSLSPVLAAERPTDLILRDAPSVNGAAVTARAAATAAEVVRVDAALLATAPERLWLEPAADAGRWAYLLEAEHGPDGSAVVWRGRFAEDEPARASVTLSLRGGVVHGRFELPGGPTWLLRPGEAGTSRLSVEPVVEAACGVGREVPEGVAEPVSGAAADRVVAAAEERLVYVLVLYTPRAAARLGAQRIEGLAPHHVDVLNTTLANSGVDGRAALAGVAEVELGMDRLADQAAVDHVFRQPAAQELQNLYQADVVSVVADGTQEFTTPFCGWANLMFLHLRGPQMADQAYNVISHRCFEVSWLFAHEVAHNFGAHHDPANSGPPELNAYPFAVAHGVDGRYRTIMSYDTACDDCGFLSSHLSNPLVSVDGFATGVHDQRDNARTLSLTFPLVASFRAGRPPSTAAPAAPSDLTATALSATEVALAWSDNADNESGFQVERTAEPAPGGGWQRIATLPADATAHVAGGLAAETDYRFRVRAVNGGAVSAFSVEAAARTLSPLPPAPTGVVALPFLDDRVSLVFAEVPRATSYEVEVRGADPAGDRVGPPDSFALSSGASGAQVALGIDGLQADSPYTFRVRAVNASGASPWSEEANASTDPAGGVGPCVEDGSTLCLLDGRFSVATHWRNPRSPFNFGGGAAREAAGSARTGFFTFFNPENVELAVKMIDGRPVNGSFWHFFGALSDVEYWVTVRDTERDGPDDRSRTYHNPPFEICGRGDTGAFPALPDTPAAGSMAAPLVTAASEAEACEAGSATLCLAGGRFEVEVDWVNPRIEGDTGVGRVFAGQEGDLAGHFWFFRPDNLELSVKILDGRAINGHYWIFWGGLSDVGYTIRVTDTETAEVHEFVNPPLTLCGGAETGVL